MNIERLLEETEQDDSESDHNLFGDDDKDRDSDSDPTFNPPSEDSPSSEEDGPGFPLEANQNINPEVPPWKERKKHPGKKRLRRTETWARERAKRARNEGQAYTDRKGTVHRKKEVQVYNHRCRYHCNNNISEEQQKSVFDSFWKLGSWDLQTSFLSSSITLEEPVRKKPNANYVKRTSCIYHLEGHRVCKSFFLKTLDISNKRVTNVISQKMASPNLIAHKDKRGHKIPSNKFDDQTMEFIKNHIRSLPRYTSHYSRTRCPNVKYLSPDLTLKKMYDMYVELCVEQNLQPVKESFYRHIFHTHFNLSFKRPHTDTCDKCDTLQNIIVNGTDNEAIENAKVQKEVHLLKVEAALKAKTNDIAAAKDDATKLVICFDLQKTLPTPSLSCKKAYYSRQLWTYNFCVHNMCNGQANMFLWHEGQGARGCQEIASCLWKFVKTLPTTVKHITVYSDNCGGQNKSHFIAKFWHYVVQKTHIETVDHKYLVVGHSFMECDQDFGIIEKAKRRNNQQVFVPSEWANVIVKSSRQFIVTQMEDSDILTLHSLEPFFKKSVPGISKMQWMHFEKEDPYTLFYKETFNMPTFNKLNMKKAGRPFNDLSPLSPATEKPKIKKLKFDNLQALLPYIPPIHHAFFNGLKHSGDADADENELLGQAEDAVLENVYDSDNGPLD